MNSHVNKLLLLALTMSGFISVVIGQSADKKSVFYNKVERQVLNANEEYDKAIVARDVAAYERILGEDFIFTSFDGTVSNKAQEIEKVKRSEVTFESGKSDDLRVKVYGKTAVVTGRFVGKGRAGANPLHSPKDIRVSSSNAAGNGN